MLKKILLMAVTVISAFALHTAEININDKDLELNAKFDMGQFNETIYPNTIFVGARFLNGEKANSKIEGGGSLEKIDLYYEVNFLMKEVIGDSGMSIGMGAKLNYTKDFSALPLGLEFEYIIPAKKLVPMYVYGSVYYAPNSLSFIDAKSFLEYRMSYNVEIIENSCVTIGYRNVNVNYRTALGNIVYNDAFYAGFKFAF